MWTYPRLRQPETGVSDSEWLEFNICSILQLVTLSSHYDLPTPGTRLEIVVGLKTHFNNYAAIGPDSISAALEEWSLNIKGSNTD